MTAWGRDGEVDAFKNMLTKIPSGVISIVSDSYDIFAMIAKLGDLPELRSLIENRDGVLVVRPDSGEPAEMVVAVLEAIAKKFPPTKNAKGFKMLPPFLRVIQGDGVSYESMDSILKAVEAAGWSAENLAFGSGGALLQKLNRDTQKCAYKASLAIVNGKEVCKAIWMR